MRVGRGGVGFCDHVIAFWGEFILESQLLASMGELVKQGEDFSQL